MTPSPSEALTAYVRAFESLRAEDVVPFYSLPCTFIRPEGVWVVQDQATALALAHHLIDHAVSQGYRRTEILQLTSRALAPSLAELSGDFERYNAHASLIARFGFTYILREESGQWKIVVAIAHDPNVVPTQP